MASETRVTIITTAAGGEITRILNCKSEMENNIRKIRNSMSSADVLKEKSVQKQNSNRGAHQRSVASNIVLKFNKLSTYGDAVVEHKHALFQTFIKMGSLIEIKLKRTMKILMMIIIKRTIKAQNQILIRIIIVITTIIMLKMKMTIYSNDNGNDNGNKIQQM